MAAMAAAKKQKEENAHEHTFPQSQREKARKGKPAVPKFPSGKRANIGKPHAKSTIKDFKDAMSNINANAEKAAADGKAAGGVATDVTGAPKESRAGPTAAAKAVTDPKAKGKADKDNINKSKGKSKPATAESPPRPSASPRSPSTPRRSSSSTCA